MFEIKGRKYLEQRLFECRRCACNSDTNIDLSIMVYKSMNSIASVWVREYINSWVSI